MTTPKHLFSLLLIMVFNISVGQTVAEIKLPLDLVTGYGPFDVDKSYLKFSTPTEDHPLYKSWQDLKFKNIPPHLQQIEKGIIWFDFTQYLYQNVNTGNLPEGVYNKYLNDRHISTPDTELSKHPIACYVLVVKAVGEGGKEVLIVDTNNNADFSDEDPVNIINYQSDKDFEDGIDKVMMVKSQSKYKGKIVDRITPLLIAKNTNEYFYSIPQYGVAELHQNRKTVTIAVSHEFKFPNYDVANITILTKQKIPNDSVVRKNQYLYIDGLLYKNLGVDFGNLSLLIKKENHELTGLQGTQNGMNAISFSGRDVKTNKHIQLADFHGKYLFIDFWGTWCSPCVAQLPKLKEIYSTIDKNKVAFLGIAGNDEIKSLRKMVYEKQLFWPNILSDSSNQIVEQYGIVAYPTGILIDPEGKIIEAKVSAYNLTDLLKKYLKN